MTTTVTGPSGYRRLRTVRNIAAIDGLIILGILAWAAYDHLTNGGPHG